MSSKTWLQPHDLIDPLRDLSRARKSFPQSHRHSHCGLPFGRTTGSLLKTVSKPNLCPVRSTNCEEHPQLLMYSFRRIVSLSTTSFPQSHLQSHCLLPRDPCSASLITVSLPSLIPGSIFSRILIPSPLAFYYTLGMVPHQDARCLPRSYSAVITGSK